MTTASEEAGHPSDGLGRLATAKNGTTWTNTYAPSGMHVQLTDSFNTANNRRYAYTGGGLLLGEYVQTGAAGHASAKAANVFHRASGGGDISRSLGSFSVGETVTVSVWFKAPTGVTGSMYLTDNAAFSATDAKKSASMQGNGDWQQLSLTQTLNAATTLSLHLYGDMYTTTSSSATDSTFVTYDDVLVSSSTRGTVMTEDFESGISAWGSCSGNLALAQPGTVPDQWKRDVIYLGGEAIAEVDASGVHELHNDHLGSPRVITNGATGAVEGRQIFGPYGEKIFPPSNTPPSQLVYQPLTGYTGHLQQDPSGLTYMRGRFYSQAWHRFINSDQGMDPNTFNQMAYVGGSPMMAKDPSGMMMNKMPHIGDEYSVIGWQFFNGGYGGGSAVSVEDIALWEMINSGVGGQNLFNAIYGGPRIDYYRVYNFISGGSPSYRGFLNSGQQDTLQFWNSLGVSNVAQAFWLYQASIGNPGSPVKVFIFPFLPFSGQVGHVEILFPDGSTLSLFPRPQGIKGDLENKSFLATSGPGGETGDPLVFEVDVLDIGSLESAANSEIGKTSWFAVAGYGDPNCTQCTVGAISSFQSSGLFYFPNLMMPFSFGSYLTGLSNISGSGVRRIW